ncbi:hypothetical protein [Amycolatopsis sp. H20-H5]|uniref:hypothetical protein n=1 Tax=Amycolatopsis sp. H20-H5 TaxID=3046309 RepID=UPI002DBC97AC|nr:hypothetical protein [Amycolatopsis sp. H20-H5]MEC3975530.1 hypothetical protein [Amycolatopsis sp. H20-H5]
MHRAEETAFRNEKLSFRALNMLRAVRDGRAQITLSCEPDFYVDGMPCCHQDAAHSLARQGLIAPARLGVLGERVTATLTEFGLLALTTVSGSGSGA